MKKTRNLSNKPQFSTNAWAYLRSTACDGQNINHQKDQIINYCDRFGIALDQVFIDKAISGRTTSVREALNDLIDKTEDVENRPTYLLVSDLSRFSRNSDDLLFFKDVLQKRGIIMQSITD